MSDRQATRQIAARLMGLGRVPADAVAYRLESGAVVDLQASSIRDLIAVAPSATAVHEVLGGHAGDPVLELSVWWPSLRRVADAGYMDIDEGEVMELRKIRPWRVREPYRRAA